MLVLNSLIDIRILCTNSCLYPPKLVYKLRFIYQRFFKKMENQIFTINIVGATDIYPNEPLDHVVVRVSIVDQSTGNLIKKSKITGEDKEIPRKCMSPYETTEYISPVCTKTVAIDNVKRLAPYWDDSFIFNESVSTILKENVVVYFEIIDLDVPQEKHHHTAIAWAFLKPLASNGTYNIDHPCKLHLHYYPKNFNPQLKGLHVPVSTLLDKSKKFLAYLSIEIKTSETHELYDVTGRPKHFFHREIGAEDISTLVYHEETEQEEIEKAETEQPTIVRPANKNCKIPRLLKAQFPVGENGAHALCFNNNGDILVAAIKTGSTYSIQFFNVYDFENSLAIIKNAHQDIIYELTFSADDKYLMSASADGDVKVWHSSGLNKQPVNTLAHPCNVYTAKFHPGDSRLVATGGRDSIVRLWDRTKNSCTAELRGNVGTVNSLVFSPDGKAMYAGDSNGIITVFNTDVTVEGTDGVSRKSVVKEDEIKGVSIVRLSIERSNFSLLVYTKDSMLRVFETKVMVPSQRYSGIVCNKFILPAVFSPDCQYILAGSEDGTAKCWTVRKADIVPTAEWNFQFTAPVTAVAWNRVENMVAFSSFGSRMPIIVFCDPAPLPVVIEEPEESDQY